MTTALRSTIQVRPPRSCLPPMVANSGAPPAELRVERRAGAGGQGVATSSLFLGASTLSYVSRRLSDLAAPLRLAEIDFGDVVAVLIVVIGMIPFASVGLWLPP